ncbi:MAG TPA: FtsQ-type POTRA domain-containing protein [Clostridia bacterium]|nr:FtsQ-type POTRA domain-containing protein [Clostridia bacterium]
MGREYVLDVKLRSSQVRAVRMRMAAIALGVVFATVFSVYLLYRTSQLALNRLVYENKTFAIQVIDLQTDGEIATDQLRRWAGVKPGANLLALDLARVKRDLELIPAIQSASIERVLPHTLRIRVIERVPMAQINVARPRTGGGVELAVLHLDAAGYIMVPLDARQRSTVPRDVPEQWPIVSGVNPNEVQAGRRLDAPQLKAALELLQAFDHSPMAGLVDLKRVDISTPEVLTVTTSQGSEVTFGLGQFDQQLRRWREIFEGGQRMGKAIATLDLAITNNIPARWLEASAVPSVTPKPPKTPRTKKKNV